MAAALCLVVVVPSTALLLVDVYLHGRCERSDGFDVWGDRVDLVLELAAHRPRQAK